MCLGSSTDSNGVGYGPGYEDRVAAKQQADALAKRQGEADALLNRAMTPSDAGDSDVIQARLREKQQLAAMAGYRSTFATGPRGVGGPSLADQQAQLDQSPGAITSPVPLPPPPVADNPADTQEQPGSEPPALTGPTDPRGRRGAPAPSPKPKIPSPWWSPLGRPDQQRQRKLYGAVEQ